MHPLNIPSLRLTIPVLISGSVSTKGSQILACCPPFFSLYFVSLSVLSRRCLLTERLEQNRLGEFLMEKPTNFNADLGGKSSK